MNNWLVTWTTNDGGIIREWKEECQKHECRQFA